MDEFFKAFESSIDRTLLRETLRLTPQQRFDKFAAFMDSVMELKECGERHLMDNKLARSRVSERGLETEAEQV